MDGASSTIASIVGTRKVSSRLFGRGQMHEFFRIELRHYQRARAADQRGQKERAGRMRDRRGMENVGLGGSPGGDP